MKAIKSVTLTVLFISICSLAFAQTKKESFAVSGNCGMCKTKIEKAAKAAGASYAEWNKETQILTVKYNSNSSNTAKIQQGIAAVGYDNAGFKTTQDVYDNLDECCKYNREGGAVSDKASCCKSTCEMKDGKCADMEACKAKGCCKDEAACKANGCCAGGMDAHAKMDCCKDGKCTMAGHDGKDCCKKEGGKMDCCKEGKCTMAGHNGKDCCKKS